MLKTTTPKILLTRPKAASERFRAHLKERCKVAEVIISPVMGICYYDRVALPEADTLVFTSVHGVEAYMRLGGNAHPVYCVGRRTAEVARKHGLHVASFAETATDLIPVLQADNPARLLHIRGRHVSLDLTKAIKGLESIELYDQPIQKLSLEAFQALSGENPVVLPLFSQRSAREVAIQIVPLAPVFGVFISKAAQAEFKNIRLSGSIVVKKPDAEAMLDASIKLYGAACALERQKQGD